MLNGYFEEKFLSFKMFGIKVLTSLHNLCFKPNIKKCIFTILIFKWLTVALFLK